MSSIGSPGIEETDISSDQVNANLGENNDSEFNDLQGSHNKSKKSLLLWAGKLELESIELRSNTEILQSKLVNVVDDLNLIITEVRNNLQNLTKGVDTFQNNHTNVDMITKSLNKISDDMKKLTKDLAKSNNDDQLDNKLDLILSNQLKILDQLMDDKKKTDLITDLTIKSTHLTGLLKNLPSLTKINGDTYNNQLKFQNTSEIQQHKINAKDSFKNQDKENRGLTRRKSNFGNVTSERQPKKLRKYTASQTTAVRTATSSIKRYIL